VRRSTPGLRAGAVARCRSTAFIPLGSTGDDLEVFGKIAVKIGQREARAVPGQERS
jgi:hypothetical protein